jgi:hypothetical protein
MIVAEYFREQRGESEEDSEDTEESIDRSGTDGGSEETASPEENGQNDETSEIEETLEKYSEYWYEPDGEKNNYAVEPPEHVDDKRRYYKTAEGAANRLTEWFE